MQEILAIIPARGGSKGLPNKNLLMMGGVPLITWTINAALESALITRVVVSTDSDKIAKAAIRAEAEPIQRPNEISGDGASSESALIHTLDSLRDAEHYEPDLVVFLQCTSPFRADGILDEAITELNEKGADSLLSVTEHTARMFELDDNGFAKPINHKVNVRPRRQELTPCYRENGSFYIFKPEILLGQDCRLGGKILGFDTEFLTSIEIDTEQEFFIADALADRILGFTDTLELYGATSGSVH